MTVDRTGRGGTGVVSCLFPEEKGGRAFSNLGNTILPGGRIIVSDIVTDGGLPESISNNLDAWAECVGGALDEGDYLGKIRNAGFIDVNILSKRSYMGLVYSAEIEAYKHC